MRIPRAGRMTVQRYYLTPSYATAAPGEAEALDLLMRIAAAGSVSKLYKRLVIEQKMRRAPAAGIRIPASITAGSPSTPSAPRRSCLPSSIRPWTSSIAELRETGVTQEELDRARGAYLAEFVYTPTASRAWRAIMAGGLPPA